MFVNGYVQGIGYRQFVKSNAKRLGLVGWVRNLSDGRVEAVVQGDKEKIEELIALCKTGPMLSEVRDVDVKWEEREQAFETFETEVTV